MAIQLKLRSTRLHSLRHYSATELAAAGGRPSHRRGTAGPRQRRSHHAEGYEAWIDEADRRAATTMASIMPKPVPVQPSRGTTRSSPRPSAMTSRPAASSSATSCPPSLSSPWPTRLRSAWPTARWRYSRTKASSRSPVAAAPPSRPAVTPGSPATADDERSGLPGSFARGACRTHLCGGMNVVRVCERFLQ
ncbi:MAG: hypothetical protein JWO56_2225 [Acidobacteria bacterium]|jgi:hypothetical protein|nr:hypothetical protein [Acidobacteriota bacterium]